MSKANDITQYSLRSWVLVLALAPTILVGILLGGYFTIDRFYELEDNLITQGKNIIEPLAIASEMSLKNNDRELSKRLLNAAQINRKELITSFAIFDSNNQIFITSHYHKNFEVMRYRGELKQLIATKHEVIGDILVVRTPIFTSSVSTNQLSPSQQKIGKTNLFNQANLSTKNNYLGYIVVMLNKEKALLEQHRAAITAFIIVLIGVQLNLFFTFRLVKHVTQPITEMVRVIAKIREGKLNTRLEGNLIGELDLLKRGINAMASSLSEYRDEMQQNIDQATSDLRETLEQIEIQNVELDLAKKRALEASRIKSEFLANMSHELRTPLNGVIGFARQLLKTQLQPSQLEYISTIDRSANNLLMIINDILDFSKLEAGKMILEKEPFSLRELINDTTTLLAGSAREKALELVVDIEQNVIDNLNGDAMRIGQIIINLIGNAIKFTDKGSVLLHIEQINTQDAKISLRFEVIDTGIGIDKKHQEILFQAFGQTDSSISRRFGGTGLGLIITKRLINQMRGQIGFTSTLHKGSTFWFVIPINIDKTSSQNPINIENLKNKKLAIYEPKSLSMSVLNKQFSQWQIDIHPIHSLNQLKQYLKTHSSYIDYFFISIQNINETEFKKIINQALDMTHKLVLINDTKDQSIISHIEQNNRLKIVSPPIGEHLLSTLFDKAGTASFSSNACIAPQAYRHCLSVLAVDDNFANLKLIEALLVEIVTDVTTAKNGTFAIDKAKTHKFDIIFMDIQMPDIDGITATQVIRANSINRNTPIIAVTAHAMAEEREQILNSGMDGYLTKPIKENELLEVIERWGTNSTLTHFDKNTLNWELCLSQANHKESLAKEMLLLFSKSLPESIKHIKLAITNTDSKNMLNTVHKLHGASCYCGVPNTQKLCFKIETALKMEQSTEDLEPEILELLDELTKVESAIKQVINELSAEQKNDQQNQILQTS